MVQQLDLLAPHGRSNQCATGYRIAYDADFLFVIDPNFPSCNLNQMKLLIEIDKKPAIPINAEPGTCAAGARPPPVAVRLSRPSFFQLYC